jgi:hypothetical protein
MWNTKKVKHCRVGHGDVCETESVIGLHIAATSMGSISFGKLLETLAVSLNFLVDVLFLTLDSEFK